MWKAASELLLRFFLAILDAWRKSEVFLRADQEVTVTLVPREVQARRKQGTLLDEWVRRATIFSSCLPLVLM